MKLYVVRHGEVMDNVLKVYNRPDGDLTETGIKQAEELRTLIKSIDYDVIISSSLIRAKHTAEIINVLNKKIIVTDALKERNAGSLIGVPLSETNREEYWNYYTTLKQGEYEEIEYFFKRIYTFLDELKNENYKSVLIVTHSGVTKAINAYFNGLGDGHFLNKGLKNGEIKEYDL